MRTALLDGPEGWLPGLLADAGASARTELLFETQFAHIAREVTMHIGTPVTLDGRTSVSIEWEASVHPERFPTLKGRLKARRVARKSTELALVATYAPPGGEAGMFADRVLMHRVAEATRKDFLTRVARVVERNAWSQAVSEHPGAIAGPED